MNRRDFLRDSSAVALGAALSRQTWAAEAPSVLIQEFPYGAVRLADSLALAQREQTHGVLIGLDLASLMRPYRERAGLPFIGDKLGGWYDSEGFAPGHTFGQWLSALSRYYAATGDAKTRDTLRQWIAAYDLTITRDGKFYQDNRFPAYISDKLNCGLVDAATLTDTPAAFKTLKRATAMVEPYLPAHAMPHIEKTPHDREDVTEHWWDESYTLPENLFRAYEASGDTQYLQLAKRFLDDAGYFDALARGENVLPGRHAYSHVNALCSAARAYLVLGERKYLDAARNGFRFVEEQSYATGGWGPDEHFVVPGSGALGEGLSRVHNTFETPCGSYGQFKIARYLLRIHWNETVRHWQLEFDMVAVSPAAPQLRPACRRERLHCFTVDTYACTFVSPFRYSQVQAKIPRSGSAKRERHLFASRKATRL